ncbi:aspartate kinase [Rhodospirillaceae bacterium KN72]|uniref:aspartate kinase n=1 Tax=Pacificispira spongiicola TaxID=2729598 RepID=A0A7Y0DX82_9PROT|nr:aspartate kinase [Pacificispira spongiicola]NMM43272.1 aspartate kinase [Pacificispira spongiicola]
MAQHTVEKIGGTSIARTDTMLDNVLIAGRSGSDLYNRIFVVSAYAGITDALLEHKKTGESGVYALYADSESDWAWGDALSEARSKMFAVNAEIFGDGTARTVADNFVKERVDGVRDCLIDLQRLCASGHFQIRDHLMTVREMLASLGEAHSAHNTALLLRENGIRARFVDLTGWRQDEDLPDFNTAVDQAFASVDLETELPIVTGYCRCRESLVRSYDRGYTEVTMSKVAVRTGAAEAIIHKEFNLSSADPKLVGADKVRTIRTTNYDVADQLSNIGMEAIHPSAAKGLRQSGIPLRVRNAFEPADPGAAIREDADAAEPGVEIVAGRKTVYALEVYEPDMVGVKGYDAAILSSLKRHRVHIMAKSSNANTITHYLHGSPKAVRRVERDLGSEFPGARISTRTVALVSAIGRNIAKPGMLVAALQALEEAGVEPLAIHDLMRKVDLQIVVNQEDHDAAIKALHKGLVEDSVANDTLKQAA